MTDKSRTDSISQVADQFVHTFWRMRRGMRSELAPFGLTFAQSRALRVLSNAAGPMRIGELAARLEIVPRSATTTVDLLEEAGVVAREADPADRRSVLVCVTPAGQALLKRMGEARRASAEAVFGRLDEEQLARLQELLELMNAPETAEEGDES